MPGTLREDLEEELLYWRPILAGKVTKQELDSGCWTLVDLVKINALMDMEIDTHNAQIEEAGKGGKSR